MNTILKMLETEKYKYDIEINGFAIIDNIYSESEIEQILLCIESADKSKETFRKSTELFAIRQFLNEIPEIRSLIFNDNLKKKIEDLFGKDYFVVKSIYFDKPENSHQDLTISVDKKVELTGFGPWTVKHNQFAVQAPLEILENICTVRIHLDDTDENNGALKVILGSHSKEIYRPETIDWNIEKETICNVNKGGIMIMKPLILHSSGRTSNGKKRRVIHIEFSNKDLPVELQWAERLDFNETGNDKK